MRDDFNRNCDFSRLSSWDVSLTHSCYIFLGTKFINVSALKMSVLYEISIVQAPVVA